VTRHGRIGVIGTPATIRSGAYERAIARIRPDIAVASAACPLFVPLAEEGWTGADDPPVRAIAARYLEPLVRQRIDTLILGCTHYPLLSAVIAAALEDTARALAAPGGELPPDVALVDGSVAVAHDLARLLTREGLEGPPAGEEKPPRHAWFVTDDPGRFRDLGVRFLGHAIEGPASVDLSAQPCETEVGT
jgi:glutamate racemase